MKENGKKCWIISSTLVLMVTFFVIFVLYVWYLGYLNPRPLELGTIVNDHNLKTIKTNGLHIPKKIQIKEKLKQQFPNLNINKMYHVRWSGKKQLLLNKKVFLFIKPNYLLHSFK
ncbi:MAG: hypothetical protein OHM56_06765 [Spiroplasma phoeniceum]|nr:MAG: hypothetical protein OHM57_06175 [Spiroplasma phoeniceum]UZQ31358.1 MAG: hypothetical protein OHM56_06765 [Spiroplasma phoeniceum]